MKFTPQLTMLSLAVTLGLYLPHSTLANDNDELLEFVSASAQTKIQLTPAVPVTAPAQVSVPEPEPAPIKFLSAPLKAAPSAVTGVPAARTNPLTDAAMKPAGSVLRSVGETQAPAPISQVKPATRGNTPAQRTVEATEGKWLLPTATHDVTRAAVVTHTQQQQQQQQKANSNYVDSTIPAENRLTFVPDRRAGSLTSSQTVKSQQNVPSPQLTPYQPAGIKPVGSGRLSVAPSEQQLKVLFYRAVMRAITDSPRINSARSQSAAAGEAVSEAKGQRWPQVDLTTSSKSMYFGGGTRPQQGGSDLPNVGINVTTSLYDFGKLDHTIKSRENQARASSIGIKVEAEDTAWQVSNALIELSKQRLIIQISQDYVTRMKELTTMLGGIAEADPGRRSELTQAKGKFLQAQSSLDSAVSKARDTEIILYRLIGETQVPLPTAPEWQLSYANLDWALQMAEQHPTIAKSQAETQAALSEARAVKASGLPAINWVVSKNTGKDIYGQTQAFQTGVQLSWGLFHGGSTRASEQAALLRAESARQQTQEQMNDLKQRVRAADQDAHSLKTRAELYKNLTVETDRIRLAFFDQWYHLGKRTLLDVLGAESDYYNNRVSEVSSRFDSYSAIFRGYASSGQLVRWLENKAQN